MQQYQLINSIHAHDGPIRSCCVGPLGEIVTGCQADAPCIRRWLLKEDNTVEEIGEAIYHDHWVVSLTSRAAGVHPCYPEGCIVTGCMDSRIRIFDAVGNPIAMLEGHAKGIISLSWTATGQLLSGSWDGTCKVWDFSVVGSGVHASVIGTCISTLGGHENGVNAVGLPSGDIITTSTGESVQNRPANFKVRVWSRQNWISTPLPSANATLTDHSGSIRSISYIPALDSVVTTSNDGTAILRGADGQPVGQMMHAPQEDGSPPFVLQCCALDGAKIVTCGEDGSVMLWQGTEFVQSLPHPKSVWTVCELPTSGSCSDFVTGGHDGILRVFTANQERLLLAGESVVGMQMEMQSQVEEEAIKKRRGPSSEEIEKAVKWEHRGAHPGKSEGQVMVFNKDGRMIAAQWTATSGAWIEIGEVTGSGDGGMVNGVAFDHVLPVEMEVPGSGVRTLQLGYNNMENPFDAAQRFIDQNSLGQHYLRQIADWIVARTGSNAPTLDMSHSSSANSASSSATSSSASSFAQSRPRTLVHFPQKVTLNQDDIIGGFQSKIIPKINEFNVSIDASCRLSDAELDAISGLVSVLTQTSYYHSSTVSPVQISGIVKMSQWPLAQNFPAFDLARLVAVHPDGARTLAGHPQSAHLLSIATQVVATPDAPSGTLLCTLRFLSNSLRFDDLRAKVIGVVNLAQVLLNCKAHARSTNKQIRLAIAILAANVIVVVFGNPIHQAKIDSATGPLLALLIELLVNENEVPDIVYRVVVAVGTMAVLGGPAIAGKIVQAGFQPGPLSILQSRWGGRLDGAPSDAIVEVLTLIA